MAKPIELGGSVGQNPNKVDIVITHGQTQLKEEAIEALEAISYWDEKEFSDGICGHKLKGMRPMLLVKNVLQQIINS